MTQYSAIDQCINELSHIIDNKAAVIQELNKKSIDECDHDDEDYLSGADTDTED